MKVKIIKKSYNHLKTKFIRCSYGYNFSNDICKLEYNSLLKGDLSELKKVINKSYNKDSLGLCVIQNVPDIKKIKDKVLDYGLKLINMTKEEKCHFTEEKNKRMIGWKESNVNWNGKEDKFIGEFLARTNMETIHYPNDPKIEKLYENVWPLHLKDFREDFKKLGEIVGKVQKTMLKYIDSYLSDLKINNEKRLLKIVENHELLGMLICYKPPSNNSSNDWISMHRDSGLLTALVHPNYYDLKTGKKVEGLSCSLEVKDRKGNLHLIDYLETDVVVQIGELLNLYSAGNITSTPHRVVFSNENKNLLRVNFPQFLDPYFSEIIDLPNNYSLEEIISNDPFKDDFKLENYQIGKSYFTYMENIHSHLYGK